MDILKNNCGKNNGDELYNDYKAHLKRFYFENLHVNLICVFKFIFLLLVNRIKQRKYDRILNTVSKSFNPTLKIFPIIKYES